MTHVCDSNPERASHAREAFGDQVAFTTEFQKVVADDTLSAVMVLSPDHLHESQAVALLDAGRAVFLEKPMAITIEGCDRMIAAAERSGALLYVGHNMRHMPFVQKMKRLVDDGAIGQVQTAWERHFINYGGDAYFKDWHCQREYSTGLLLQKGAHDLDVMHWVCGGYTRRVHAMGRLSVYNRAGHDRWRAPGDATPHAAHWPPLAQRDFNPAMDVEDVSLLNAELDNGILMAYQQCHYTPDSCRNYTFIGDRGRMESTFEPDGAIVIRVWNQRCSCDPRGDENYVFKPAAEGHGGADPAMLKQFLECLLDGAEPQCPPLAARMAVAAGCQATLSLRQGGIPLDIPPVQPVAVP